MKPHIKFKGGKWWVFSSKRASLDCLPQCKTYTLYMALKLIKGK